jgi:hypothetical protein
MVRWFTGLRGLLLVVGLLLPAAAFANLLQSSHFRLDPNVTNSVGGAGSSTSYGLTDSGGEAAVGSGSSGSYKLTQGYVAQLTHSISLSVLPHGIAAYYPLDTGTGIQAYDVSTNENRGVLTNTPTWVTGKVGQALGFNGTNQYVDIPSSTSLSLSDTVTIEAWVNIANYTNTNTLVSKTSGTGAANDTYELRTQASTGLLQFVGFDTAQRTVTSVIAVPTATWVHVAATKGGGTVILYINGVDQGRGPVAVTTTNTNSVKLGARDDLTNYLNGSLDEVRLYNRTLSAAEIANDYTAGVNGLRFAHTFPNVTPGTSQFYDIDAIVRTDAPGYNLFIQAPKLLTNIVDGTTTIPPITATIASPASWSEGVTKGLGFSVISATQLESKWGTGPFNYAALPTLATAYHSRVGDTAGLPEKTTLEFKADTAPSQRSGTYQTTVIYTATYKP